MSNLEDTLHFQLRALKIDKRHPYGREVKFHPERKWRADFLWGPPAKLMVEIDGGTWNQGRHTRGQGFENDREKDHAAALLGYVPLHFSSKQVTNGSAAKVIEDFLKYFGKDTTRRVC